MTFALKMPIGAIRAQLNTVWQPRTLLKLRPESGLDWLLCDKTRMVKNILNVMLVARASHARPVEGSEGRWCVLGSIFRFVK